LSCIASTHSSCEPPPPAPRGPNSSSALLSHRHPSSLLSSIGGEWQQRLFQLHSFPLYGAAILELFVQYSRPSRSPPVMKGLGSVSRERKERDLVRTISKDCVTFLLRLKDGRSTSRKGTASDAVRRRDSEPGRRRSFGGRTKKKKKTESFGRRARRRLAFGTDAACPTARRGTMCRWVRPMSAMEGTAPATCPQRATSKQLRPGRARSWRDVSGVFALFAFRVSTWREATVSELRYNSLE
jgi:hypothetical protein